MENTVNKTKYRISYLVKTANGAFDYKEETVDWKTACVWCGRWDTIKRQENPSVINFKIERV